MGSRTICVLLMRGPEWIQLKPLKTLANDIISPAATHLDDTRFWPCCSSPETLRVYCKDTPAGAARRLLRLHHATWSHNAMHTRDKMYSLLGLLDPEIKSPAELTPSYKTRPEKVYHNYTKWLIENVGDTIILEGRSLVHALVPSWITNMAEPTTYEFVDLIYNADDLPQTLLEPTSFQVITRWSLRQVCPLRTSNYIL